MLYQMLKEVPNVVSNKLATVLVSISLSIYLWQVIYIHQAAMSLRETALQVWERKTLNVDIYPALYKEYLVQFNKSYHQEEMERRLQFFKNSLMEISRLNKETGATHDLTKFADMSYDELPGLWPDQGDCNNQSKPCLEDDDDYVCDDFRVHDKIPDKFDWRDHDRVVGPVLNQKLCNGCWAFGIVGVMESMSAIQNIKRGISLSIQELIDCTPPFYSNGCTNGSVNSALYWLCTDKVAVLTEEEYLLVLVTDTCKLENKIPLGRRVRHYCRLCNGDVNDILGIIANHGPVMTVVNARPWLYYTGGVIQRACDRDDNSKDLLHVVQIVGYDRTAEVPHYIIRNSWGEDFGVKGYIKLALEENVCGVRNEILYLTVY